MLLELKIQDFALMRSCDIELRPGLNVLTGETGAGKSIIIDGVAAILGGRMSAGDVRQGADQAIVEGAFDPEKARGAIDLVTDMGIDADGEVLILTREIPASGRSKCRINGRLANARQLADIGKTLVDIHGQHDHQSLLQTAHHMDLLDSLGGDRLAALVREVEQLVDERNELIKERRRLEHNFRERAQREDLLRYQIEEIESAALQPDEEQNLWAERQRLTHAGRILEAVTRAYEALYGEGGGNESSANEALGIAKHQLQEVQEYDDSLAGVLSAVDETLSVIQDAALDLRRYAEGIDLDPNRLAEVEERFELITRLKRKYGDTLEEIDAFLNQAQEELAELTQSEERLASINERLRVVEENLSRQVVKLSELRQETARRAEEAICSRLAKLQMPEARFVVRMEVRDDDRDGLLVNGRRVHVSRRGIDHVEFLFSANPGEEVRPLARIASGGEMSRVMLAIKGALAEIDPVPTLIFDEVDSGLGGRAAESVADALSELARTHQVLVVTHLAQIAARADRHIGVSKRAVNGETEVRVTVLEGEDRIRELARMLDGNETSAGMEHARSLLRLAHKGNTAS